MRANAETEAAVMDTLKRFNEAYQRKDVDSLLAMLAPDPDGVFIGTGADERRIGLDEAGAQIERDFAQSDVIFWELGWHSVSAAGPVAWLAADVIIHVKIDEREIGMPIRLTAVLEKRGDKWLFVQLHNSVPAADQKVGESFPTL
jgi:ketosteroid isomerase-like protein